MIIDVGKCGILSKSDFINSTDYPIRPTIPERVHTIEIDVSEEKSVINNNQRSRRKRDVNKAGNRIPAVERWIKMALEGKKRIVLLTLRTYEENIYTIWKYWTKIWKAVMVLWSWLSIYNVMGHNKIALRYKSGISQKEELKLTSRRSPQIKICILQVIVSLF